jgi:hypothetical protein
MSETTWIAFQGTRKLGQGTLAHALSLAKIYGPDSVQIFEAHSGDQVHYNPDNPIPKRNAGRPKLGVVSREISLLPHHWAWLQSQPGGASATIRRLIDQALPHTAPAIAAERILSVVATNLPGLEQVLNGLRDKDKASLEEATADWPEDLKQLARNAL